MVVVELIVVAPPWLCACCICTPTAGTGRQGNVHPPCNMFHPNVGPTGAACAHIPVHTGDGVFPEPMVTECASDGAPAPLHPMLYPYGQAPLKNPSGVPPDDFVHIACCASGGALGVRTYVGVEEATSLPELAQSAFLVPSGWVLCRNFETESEETSGCRGLKALASPMLVTVLESEPPNWP